jgi:hypothetical protein
MQSSRWAPRLGLAAALTILTLSFILLLAGARGGTSLPDKPTDASRTQMDSLSSGSGSVH